MREMSFSVEAEQQLFILSILLGVGIGLFYDLFRAIRALVVHNKAATFFEDMIFILVSGFAFFVFATGLTGKLRYATVIGALMGFVVEHYSVGNLIILPLRRISKGVRGFVKRILRRFLTKKDNKISADL